MKSLFYLILASIVLLASCGKTGNPVWQKSGKNIFGKWTYTDYYLSTGGPGEWQQVKPANQSIEFKTDGSFVATESFLKGATTYQILDSTRIRFQPTSTTSGFTLMGYSVEKEGKELYLYPIDPICIEGCNNKFTR